VSPPPQNASVPKTVVVIPNGTPVAGFGAPADDGRTAAAAGDVIRRVLTTSAEIRVDAHPGPAPSGNDQAQPLAPLARGAAPISGGEPSEPPAAAPLGKPSLAELLTPTGWDASAAVRTLRQLFPTAEAGGRDLAAELTRLLRSPWLPAAVVALVGLEVLRRRLRLTDAHVPPPIDMPGITGPSGL
jgi:hypothetical protein